MIGLHFSFHPISLRMLFLMDGSFDVWFEFMWLDHLTYDLQLCLINELNHIRTYTLSWDSFIHITFHIGQYVYLMKLYAGTIALVDVTYLQENRKMSNFLNIVLWFVIVWYLLFKNVNLIYSTDLKEFSILQENPVQINSLDDITIK